MNDTTNSSLRDQAEAMLALLNKTATSDEPFPIDHFVHRLLARYHKIAVIWCVEDMLGVRPDLTEDQTWEALQDVQDKHDADWGITWTMLQDVADALFPQKDRQP